MADVAPRRRLSLAAWTVIVVGSAAFGLWQADRQHDLTKNALDQLEASKAEEADLRDEFDELGENLDAERAQARADRDALAANQEALLGYQAELVSALGALGVPAPPPPDLAPLPAAPAPSEQGASPAPPPPLAEPSPPPTTNRGGNAPPGQQDCTVDNPLPLGSPCMI